MKKRVAVSCCVAGVLLFAAAVAIHRTAPTTIEQKKLAAWVYTGFRSATERTKATVTALVPEPMKPHIKQLLAGATSVTLVGQGFRRIPGIATAISASAQTTKQQNVVEIIMAKPVDKLLYAVGAIFAQAFLLRLLVKPPGYWGPVKDQKVWRNFFTTQAGWFLLVVCVALPNCVVDAGFIITLLGRLPSETYLPALVVGKLLQPYVATALFCSPTFVRWLPQVWKVMDAKGSEDDQSGAKVVFWALLTTAVLLAGTNGVTMLWRRDGSNDEEEELVLEDAEAEN
ncbi:hypothetical protein, conserved [Trypanosoma brucei brucei TREU927]|uniref:Uncharacterized protein n=1 Tax=Trypanosoma brucei brucei (strain 927/4 GUTat10.1) TaxID=185431 RepID=Q57XE3_TRYB2|nr:hypothetical protein, conserved [Trypanosoma brucei brucei TREU927]AAX69708.1 hypothetical protein, conserved [Trypanosoma brucei]AAZ13013.1 hypothetical protein, conserved [Trypanosoma brucei brucei TREU927]